MVATPSLLTLGTGVVCDFQGARVKWASVRMIEPTHMTFVEKRDTPRGKSSVWFKFSAHTDNCREKLRAMSRCVLVSNYCQGKNPKSESLLTVVGVRHRKLAGNSPGHSLRSWVIELRFHHPRKKERNRARMKICRFQSVLTWTATMQRH